MTTTHIRLLYLKTVEFLEALKSEPRVRAYLSDLSSHHNETYEHSLRVGLLSVDLGYENGFEDKDLRLVGFAGLLHDIGKMKVPVKILSKKDKLDTDERKIINGHPRLGFLELNDPEYDIVRQMVAGHHEYKKDPYPRKGHDRRMRVSSGERRNSNGRVSISTQVIAVSDIYDALASRRSYKGHMTIDEIKLQLREQFTGDAVYIAQILRRHPNS